MNTSDQFERATRQFPLARVSAIRFAGAWAARPLARSEYAGDVLLAAAIEDGDEWASGWLLSSAQSISGALRRKYETDVVSDTISHVIEHLTVDRGRGRGIARYSGTGPLLGWLQVVLARQTYLHAQSKRTVAERGRSEQQALHDLSRSLNGFEKHLLQRDFMSHLSEAMKAAGAALSDRQRALLSLHYLESVPLEALAVSYQVHRSTVARWIAQAKEAFVTALRSAMESTAAVPSHEVDSLVRALISQADVSMRLVLNAANPTTEPP